MKKNTTTTTKKATTKKATRRTLVAVRFWTPTIPQMRGTKHAGQKRESMTVVMGEAPRHTYALASSLALFPFDSSRTNYDEVATLMNARIFTAMVVELARSEFNEVVEQAHHDICIAQSGDMVELESGDIAYIVR
jgi:hypothetical protein